MTDPRPRPATNEPLSGGARFVTKLLHDDLIVRDHTVHGVRIMPGVTFIDVIVRALQSRGAWSPDTELGRIVFREVVATAPGVDREIAVAVEPRGAEEVAAWKVVVESRPCGAAAPGHTSFTQNLSCDIVRGRGEHLQPIDLARLVSCAERVVDLDSVYAIARSMRIEHGPFMKTEGRIHCGSDYVLADVSLSPCARQFVDEFVLHPALMDAATLPYAALMQRPDAVVFDSPFIPIYVEAFRAFGAPRERIFVLVQKEGGAHVFEDVLYNDIQVLDEAGTPLAHFRKLGAKRIRRPDLITRQLAAVPVPTANAAQAGNEHPQSPAAASRGRPQASGADAISGVLTEMAAQILGKPTDAVDPDVGFYDLGLESTDLLKLVQDLEQRLGSELYPTLLFEYSTIHKLAAFLNDAHGAYWVQGTLETSKPSLPPPDSAPSAVRTAIATEVLVPGWHLKGAWTASSSGPKRVAVFSDGSRDDIDALFSDFSLAFVQLSSSFEERSAEEVSVDRRAPADYDRALEAAFANGAVDAVVFWAGLSSGYHDELESVMDAHRVASALARRKMEHPPVFVHVASALRSGPGAAVAGMLRCLALEFPALASKVLYVDHGLWQTPGKLAECLAAELDVATTEREIEVSYSGGERRVRRLSVVPGDAGSGVPERGFRHQGTYVISGGGGRLGLFIAGHCVRKYSARVVLLGRSELDAERTAFLEQLQNEGGRVCYLQADVTNKGAVKRALRLAKQRYGKIHGVLHCAGLAVDGLLRTQHVEDTRAVWDTKLLGARALDEATHDEELDFFVTFGSLSALSGNVGQSAYAGANAWLSAWTRERARQVAAGERSGRSLCISWPLWAMGGMHPGESVARVMEKSLGLIELDEVEGLGALERCLRLDVPEAAVFKGRDPSVLEALLRLVPGLMSKRPAMPSPQPAALDAAEPATGAMAIIGISGRYPDAPDLDSFWANLCAARDSITEIPKSRWNVDAHFDARRNVPGKSYARWGGFLEDVDQFDPLFFNIGPHEAVAMDPQERLFLQCAWSTLEDAGYARSASAETVAADQRKVGVFVGVMWQEYQILAAEEVLRGNMVLANSSAASVANRVSYCFDLTGPSVPVDTMCSSSLMSIHLACESIRRGECSMALAGGVNLMLHPSKYAKLCQMQMLSSDGRCRSFGKGGDGYVPGEGVGCVLIKPLERAIADGDHIYAVIRGTAVNHGGRTGGMTVPSPAAQAELIRECLTKAKVSPAGISYVEAHGTGTALGDPIEVLGLTRAFAEQPPERCALGSVKSNIGHLEAAAGIAAITKVVLQLRHRTLVPSLHAEETNAEIDFDATPFVVQRGLEAWELPTGLNPAVRRASVSSFGAGGVNVHVVLEEFESTSAPVADADSAELVVLSAKKEPQVHEAAARLLHFVRSRSALTSERDVTLRNIAHTSRCWRESFRHRFAVVASNLDELARALEAFVRDGELRTDAYCGDAKQGVGRGAGGSIDLDAPPAGTLEDTAQRWVTGRMALPIESRASATRISLPTYPFERKCYWIAQSRPEPTSNHASGGRQEEPRRSSTVKRASGIAAIERRLIELLAVEIDLSVDEIEIDEPLDRYGVDSVVGAKLLARIEQVYGPLPIALLYDKRTLAEVAAYVMEQGAAETAAHPPQSERTNGARAGGLPALDA